MNLTFQDFAQVRQHNAEKTKPSLSPTMETISEKSEKKSPRSSPMAKLPSLDFSKGLEASLPSPHHRHHPQEGGVWGRDDHHGHHRHHLDHGGDQRSMVYDDMSGMSVAYGPERGGGRRRPGIPHSNICALCCNYIYICRHRCLVYLIFSCHLMNIYIQVWSRFYLDLEIFIYVYACLCFRFVEEFIADNV